LSINDDYETTEDVLLFETTYASLIACITAEDVRAVIDNTDTNVGVLPINSSMCYTDFRSCLKSIEETKGNICLYKDIGCVLLKLSLLYGEMLLAHGVVIKICY
ncbi:unnamed protein product, partial [Rotaria sp. Silwood1]